MEGVAATLPGPAAPEIVVQLELGPAGGRAREWDTDPGLDVGGAGSGDAAGVAVAEETTEDDATEPRAPPNVAEKGARHPPAIVMPPETRFFCHGVSSRASALSVCIFTLSAIPGNRRGRMRHETNRSLTRYRPRGFVSCVSVASNCSFTPKFVA